MENNITEQVAKNTYNEVYGVLLALGNDFMDKIPNTILTHIKQYMTYVEKNGKKAYKIPKYNLKVSLNLQGVSKEALAIIYYFYCNYWCSTDKEKKYIQNLIKNNEMKVEVAKKEKYNECDMFKRKEKQEEKMLINTNETNWFKKIIEKILSVFKKR